jgi:probable addiction module antidote protein
MKGTRDHQEYIIEQLQKNPRFREEYINQALQEENEGVRWTMLRNAASATIGFTKLSKASGIQRQSLYKTLSASGNPEYKSVEKILSVLGYRLIAVKAGHTKTRAIKA